MTLPTESDRRRLALALAALGLSMLFAYMSVLSFNKNGLSTAGGSSEFGKERAVIIKTMELGTARPLTSEERLRLQVLLSGTDSNYFGLDGSDRDSILRVLNAKRN
jgi:hypothetical protein